MSMEEDAIRLQPGLEGSVPFHLPEGKSRVDTDMEADCVVVVVHGVFVGWMTDAVNILGQFFARWDVTIHCNASKGRVEVDQKDGVLVVDILKLL